MISFVLINSDHGAMIVNRLDYNQSFNGEYYGVGAQLLETGNYDSREVRMLCDLLVLRREYCGDGVMVLDCGANIGVHTVGFAQLMRGWGKVIAVEAQERLFYALAGNMALHNCKNARAVWGAVDHTSGYIDIPEPDYDQLGSFGSFELKQRLGNENIGQEINYDKKTLRVQSFALDELDLKRCDLIKLDIEGMELDALAGARKLIERCRPLLFVEAIKVGREPLKQFFSEIGYRHFNHGMNLLGGHADDSTLTHIQTEGNEA
jgi:FkbM family methyltransferase